MSSKRRNCRNMVNPCRNFTVNSFYAAVRENFKQQHILFLITVANKTSSIRANFENLAKEKEQEDRRKAEAERAQRMAREKQEQEEARRKLEVSRTQILFE